MSTLSKAMPTRGRIFAKSCRQARRTLILVLLSCLMTFSACSTANVVPRPAVTSPPEVFLQESGIPPLYGNTVADLLEYIVDLQAIIEQHDADKASLKSWYAATRR